MFQKDLFYKPVTKYNFAICCGSVLSICMSYHERVIRIRVALTVSMWFSMHPSHSSQLAGTGENLNREPLKTCICTVAAA